jgi:hypothetical protein
MNCHSNCSVPIFMCPVSSNRIRMISLLTFISLGTWSMAKAHNLSSPIVALSHVFESTKRWEWSFTTNTSYGDCQQKYEDTPNIGLKVFMRVTQRLLERNRDIFKPIMEFHFHLIISGLQVTNQTNLPER